MPYIGNTSQKFVTADDVTVTDDLTVTDDATIGGALSAKGGAVFNEDSADVDFRVESNNTAHLFFADGGEDVVGIGTPTPVPSNVAYKTAALHIHQEQGGSTGSQIHMTNDATGAAAGNGMFIAMWQDDDVYITNQESDGNIKFATGGTNNVLVLKDGGDIDVGAGDIVFSTAGKGIVLGATSNTAANTLDDYEEGTWTPNFDDLSNTPNYHNLYGTYTKIGRKCTVQFFAQTAGSPNPTFNTTSGVFKVTGLPFTVLPQGYSGSQGCVNAQSFNYHGSNNNQGVSGTSSNGGCYLTSSVTASEQMEFNVTHSGGTRGKVNNVGAAQGFIIEATCTYFTSD